MPRRSISERELRQFKLEFARATREKDRPALERMIHDEFTLIDPEGNVVEKTQLIDTIMHADSDFMREFNRAERRTSIEVRGNTARDTADVKLRGTLHGRGDVTGEYMHTATFIRGTGGAWQMLGNTLHKK